MARLGIMMVTGLGDRLRCDVVAFFLPPRCEDVPAGTMELTGEVARRPRVLVDGATTFGALASCERRLVVIVGIGVKGATAFFAALALPFPLTVGGGVTEEMLSSSLGGP
jgi:hypothetical protein